MSRSSIKPSSSPTIEETPNDELAAGAEQGSYHEAFRESGERARQGKGSWSHNQKQSSQPLMNYPVDENLFHSTPTPTQPLHAQEAGEESEYQPPPTAEEVVHPPDFRPFFTLIEDPETGEYHHPTVHYIFSDDDPEILTSAVLDTLDRSEETSENNTNQTDAEEERFVILDIAADGKSVVSASSLSPDWQALQTAVAQAPSWGAVDNGGEERTLMLKISGQTKGKVGAVRDAKRQQEGGANIEDFVKSYSDRLDRLDEMIGKS